MTTGRELLASALLFSANILLILVSLSLLMLSNKMDMVEEISKAVDESDQGSLTWRQLSILIFITSMLLFLVAVFGLSAALCESTLLFDVFVIMVVICCSVLLAVAGLGFGNRSAIVGRGRHFYEQLAGNYSTDPDAAYLVQQLQSSAQCCGDQSPDYWHRDPPFAWANRTIDLDHYPSSCCGAAFTFIGAQSGEIYRELCSNESLRYYDGCFSPVQTTRYQIFAAFLVAFLLLTLVSLIVLACCAQRGQLLDESRAINLKYAAHMHKCPVVRGPWLPQGSQATQGSGGPPAAKTTNQLPAPIIVHKGPVPPQQEKQAESSKGKTGAASHPDRIPTARSP